MVKGFKVTHHSAETAFEFMKTRMYAGVDLPLLSSLSDLLLEFALHPLFSSEELSDSEFLFHCTAISMDGLTRQHSPKDSTNFGSNKSATLVLVRWL